MINQWGKNSCSMCRGRTHVPLAIGLSIKRSRSYWRERGGMKMSFEFNFQKLNRYRGSAQVVYLRISRQFSVSCQSEGNEAWPAGWRSMELGNLRLYVPTMALDHTPPAISPLLEKKRVLGSGINMILLQQTNFPFRFFPLKES